MQNGWSCIKDSINFIKKIKHLKNIRLNALLVAADVIGLYPSIPHKPEIRALKECWTEVKKKDLYCIKCQNGCVYAYE